MINSQSKSGRAQDPESYSGVPRPEPSRPKGSALPGESLQSPVNQRRQMSQMRIATVETYPLKDVPTCFPCQTPSDYSPLCWLPFTLNRFSITDVVNSKVQEQRIQHKVNDNSLVIPGWQSAQSQYRTYKQSSFYTIHLFKLMEKGHRQSAEWQIHIDKPSSIA